MWGYMVMVVLSICCGVMRVAAMMWGMAIGVRVVFMPVLMTVMSAKITVINARVMMAVPVPVCVVSVSIRFLVVMGEWIVMTQLEIGMPPMAVVVVCSTMWPIVMGMVVVPAVVMVWRRMVMMVRSTVVMVVRGSMRVVISTLIATRMKVLLRTANMLLDMGSMTPNYMAVEI